MSNKHALSIFSLTMITVGSVDSIRNLPATALFGSQLISFFFLGALFFLIPTALVSAELASGWAKQGGIYIWVKEAFGKRAGFLAIWLQWIENVIWYPTILSFVAGTIGYLINPAMADNPYFLWLVIVCSFWGATLVNLRGMKSSALFSNICAISGLLLPMGLIIGLGAVWLAGGNPLQVQFDLQSISPHWQDRSMWVSLTAIMMSFCGIEIATVHANDVNNPQHAFPRALIYSVLIILSTLILGSLAIAVVLPNSEINLVAGIMQAFNAFFKQYHLVWMMPIVALMLVMGGLGGVSNWIIAPTKGLLVAAQDGNLPMFFQRTNRQNAPVVMLITQAVIVTLLSTLFLFMPSVNGSYWLLTALAAQLYMLMYLMMFLAAIKLRFSAPDHYRAFRIPGGKAGLLFVSSVGIIGTLATLVVSFMPPENINVGSTGRYELTLILGLLLMCSPPLISSLWQSRGQFKAAQAEGLS
ncbi:glutamate/gamma-aminobutyrate antiporter [Legionella quinlivanii]|uniref:Glutamate/gamma-aminobutyrate antiporter n=1 Tax=Legionella quinlivanii TaxID=45073 RepID=A0A0W0Y5S4_9GAMM|nr:APC family permease [Legionella quinlivanii]KTD51875.1 glutamate/gamma-aminobutyrate antiporter [Legionella quinlivanii]MCW8452135.1 APC family permease [Legionella quinlivanii]SEF83548.1 amino acid/polyamine/organocation transporter, APC superfamily (TC 2.A.3) [Legionella quinlivanii DSM 21216]STY09664.1 Amino acid transporter [Legionella quinlivanii]